jgi:hypothetical protein
VRSGFYILVAVGLSVLLLAACAPAESGRLTLDLDTLQASAEPGDFQAEPVANALVGEVTEELFVAVVVPDVVEEGQEVRVYLCDGENFAQWISGELDAAGEARLGERIGAQVHLRIEENGEVFGVAQVPGEGPQPFRATAATGDAGLYRAEETFNGVTHVGGWIVLPDGRQRGDFCCGCIVICFPHCCIIR